MQTQKLLMKKDTSNFVAAKLESFGVEVHGGFGGTGLVGVIHGNQGDPASGKAIGLRADMDALPMSEETNLTYASQRPGRMHACGHDGHTRCCSPPLGTLHKHESFMAYLLFFQPAEEGGNAGARSMIDDGLFEKFHMDSSGACIIGRGLRLDVRRSLRPAMAGADIFIFTIEGKGGHAAMPHYPRSGCGSGTVHCCLADVNFTPA